MHSLVIKKLANNRRAKHNSLEKLREIQHFIELGRMSASLIHEISNPLSAAILHLEQARDHKASSIDGLRQNIKILISYVEAARQQVRLQSPETSFSVRSQINQVKQVLLPLAQNAGVRLYIDPVPTQRLFGDAVKFQQILSNLIVNAVQAYQATDSGLHKYVRLSITCNQNMLTLQVIDRGMGIPSNCLDKIFEPFYSTKHTEGRGLGIGLAIVRDFVVQSFNGSIDVKSSARLGTVFTVNLPLKEPAYKSKSL